MVKEEETEVKGEEEEDGHQVPKEEEKKVKG